MTLDLAAAISTRFAVILLIAAAWYRRRSWSNRWQQPITLHLILLAVGMTAATDLVSVRGSIAKLTYTDWLGTYIGDVATIFGFAALASTMLARVSFNDTDAQHLVSQRVMPIVTLAPAFMLAARIESQPNTPTQPPELFPATEGWLAVADGWQIAYCCTFYIGCGTLAAITAWAAHIVATDPRSRFGARLWVFAMRCTTLACLVGVVNAVTVLQISWLVWILSAIGAIASAAAAWLSWRKRMQPFRRLLQFTHTTRGERRTFNTLTQRRHVEGGPTPAV
ncbi:hypothetical protein PBI_OMNICRON_43 [Mycobacterium phage Omnicron]|uniref:Transmembrane protein n=1 Tax=Mycobacterium phage Omnicron TaxID=1541819 RepID=A0A088FV08_9CAUD|nr:hypothetical protein PBI_OMNICRON_43 [Mycobacterium phage Omnicron]AIM50376.1 hypothetical protein PBI_OMNICRON_43 [Mycobacterium phage Omnicron]